MMSQGPDPSSLETEFNAPFNKQVRLEHLVYDNGFPMLKVRIREGRRFTTMELDPDTAAHWGRLMLEWAERNNPHGAE